MRDFVYFSKNLESNVIIAVGMAVGIQQLGDHPFELWDQLVPGRRFRGETGHIVARSNPYLRFSVPNSMNDQRLPRAHSTNLQMTSAIAEFLPEKV